MRCLNLFGRYIFRLTLGRIGSFMENQSKGEMSQLLSAVLHGFFIE